VGDAETSLDVNPLACGQSIVRDEEAVGSDAADVLVAVFFEPPFLLEGAYQARFSMVILGRAVVAPRDSNWVLHAADRSPARSGIACA
jgi:hypothetical protein